MRGGHGAWWATAFEVESFDLEGTRWAMGSVDCYKCFDQVVRPRLYALLLKARGPATSVSAYARFQDRVQVRLSVSGGLGAPLGNVCGIPQGDPLSMTFLALLMTPWVRMMKMMHVVPGLLADDVHLTAEPTDQ